MDYKVIFWTRKWSPENGFAIEDVGSSHFVDYCSGSDARAAMANIDVAPFATDRIANVLPQDHAKVTWDKVNQTWVLHNPKAKAIDMGPLAWNEEGKVVKSVAARAWVYTDLGDAGGEYTETDSRGRVMAKYIAKGLPDGIPQVQKVVAANVVKPDRRGRRTSAQMQASRIEARQVSIANSTAPVRLRLGDDTPPAKRQRIVVERPAGEAPSYGNPDTMRAIAALLVVGPLTIEEVAAKIGKSVSTCRTCVTYMGKPNSPIGVVKTFKAADGKVALMK